MNGRSAMFRITVVAAALTLAGCSLDVTPTGPTQHETKSIDLDKSERVRVNVAMGAGELNVRGGASQLMNADFSYNVAAWKPEVHYDGGGTASLRIDQPSAHGASMGGSAKNVWDLRFNNDVPLDMAVH